jgi:non-lysosomal glucosylceramidase
MGKSGRGTHGRREFLKQSLTAAAVVAVPAPAVATQAPSPEPPALSPAVPPPGRRRARVSYPRVFTGPQLSQISFPLGGVGAGSIGLGGRGQLRDWQIFNRPNHGNAPGYAFPAIRVDRGARPPFVSVLEARLEAPYQGAFGLGSRSAPGLQRLESARFTGEFPLAEVRFRDRRLPVRVTLDAFSPFIPHDADASGLPVAVLRYRVSNPQATPAAVSIAYSLENPLLTVSEPWFRPDPRVNEVRTAEGIQGLLMHNPSLYEDNPFVGTLGLWVIGAGDEGRVTMLRGWPRAKWWTSALRFWDDFSADGALGPESPERGPVGAVCLQRTLAPGATADYTFLLSWHFPNRTPDGCGWDAADGEGGARIGNHYCTRFTDAWHAAQHAAGQLETLEQRTRLFASAIRESTIPAAIKDAATANLSTLVTPTCFRTADGEFHGFEGCADNSGCCFGNCTHVWNYEAATDHVFPELARSLRRAAFGYSMDADGGMRFRQLLPDGADRFPTAAADGQMGQIMKVYLDWRLSGDDAWLRELWPKVKRAIAFAWIPDGWDADRDGVLEGTQHNTYDIEFYGPNPLCGIYYLGALRAVEEMARATGDDAAGTEARRLFESGRTWIDANLFNGEYYVQQVQGRTRASIPDTLLNTMGSADTEHPEYQMGAGCLVDQLVGQYQAEVAGLGPLVDPAHCRTTLESIYRYNYKRDLFDHANLQRTFVLNDEAALVVAAYADGQRPDVPFPYYAEAFTGLEYTAASHMIFAGMVREGVECITNIRARYDGERRDPWDEAECGSHYARAMSAWSALLAISGFRYHGRAREVTVLPRLPIAGFRCFWSTATGWGTFAFGDAGSPLHIRVLSGSLACQVVVLPGGGRRPPVRAVRLGDRVLPHTLEQDGGTRRVILSDTVVIAEGHALVLL